MQRFNAGEEPRIKQNGVAVRGKFWRHLFLDFLNVGIGVRGSQIAEKTMNAREQLSGTFEGNDRILEGRSFRAIGNLVHFFQRLFHSSFQRRREVLVLDAIERRELIRQRAFSQERIVRSGENLGSVG